MPSCLFTRLITFVKPFFRANDSATVSRYIPNLHIDGDGSYS